MNRLKETCSFDLNKVTEDGSGVPGEGVTLSREWRLMELHVVPQASLRSPTKEKTLPNSDQVYAIKQTMLLITKC